MKARGWWIRKLHGNEFQAGLPDYVAAHIVHGQRWIELKLPDNTLEATQIETFKEMHAHGVPVYILRGIEDYPLLFRPANYMAYLMTGNAAFNRPKGT